MKKSLVLLAFLAFLPNAFAQQAYIIPGSRPGSDSGVLSLANGNTFRTFALKDRSVYCRYRSATATDITLSEIIACGSGTCPTARLVGDVESGTDQGIGADDAIAFIANDNPADGFLPVDNYYDMTVVAVAPSPSNVIIECFNTTLYGNFNTVSAANPFNFLELSNDSNVGINTRVVVTKNDGTILSTLNIFVGEGQQRDISIHDIAGAANTFGRITVAHDGALHGIRAKLTKYTSSFVITASDKLETRGNEQ